MRKLVRLKGPIAQDKDVARDYRCRVIFPAVRNGTTCVLDFARVELATQSFVHALLSEVFRAEGDRAVRLLEFKNCRPRVQTVIETVAQYSLQARTIAETALAGVIHSVDVPQADRLSTIRAVVDAAANGNVFSSGVAAAAGISIRHAHYRLHAARILGFVNVFPRSIVLVTEQGELLATTAPGSSEERRLFVQAVRASEVLGKIAPGLLSGQPPRPRDIAKQMKSLAGLSEATAARRANVLLSWRRQLVQENLNLWPHLRSGRDP